MAKMLRFGGPNLTEGQHTWFERPTAGGGVELVRANPGDVVDADTITDADGYIDRRQASYEIGISPEPSPTEEADT